MHEYFDEALADFQQYYSLRLEEELESHKKRVPALLLQLPENSRVAAKEHPENSWSMDRYMLRSIEYSLRVLCWQQTADGQSKRPKNTPEIIKAPWEYVEKDKPEQQYLTNKDVGDLKQFFKRKFRQIESSTI